MEGKSTILRGNEKGTVIKRQTIQIISHQEWLQVTTSHITRAAMSACEWLQVRLELTTSKTSSE